MPHWLWTLTPEWGNTSPAHALIARLLEVNPNLEITAIYIKTYQARVEADWCLYPSGLQTRLHIVYGGIDHGKVPHRDTVTEEMKEAVQGVLDGIDPHKPPSKFVMGAASIRMLADWLQPKLPAGTELWAQDPLSAVMLHLMLAPAPHGLGDGLDIAERLGGGTETMIQLMRTQNGKLELDGTLVHLPGCPDIFDWERALINVPTFDHNIFPRFLYTFSKQRKMDGLFISTCAAAEREGIAACQKLHKRVVAAGACVNPRAWANERLQPGPLASWLGKQSRASTIAVCFGSMVYPMKTELTILIDALVEFGRPFVFVDPTSSYITDEFRETIDGSGHGFVATGWMDTIGLLNDPSVRTVLWHGGWGTFNETILAGKTLIAWPLYPGDEAVNTNWAATRAEPVAWELLQIRKPKHPARRNGGVEVVGTPGAIKAEMLDVFGKAFGPESAVIQQNVDELAAGMRRDRHGADWDALSEVAFS